MSKKQGLQRPSERILAAQREANKPPTPLQGYVTLHTMAEILTLSSYAAEMVRDGCRARMADIKTDLGYEGASGVERLLIDQIALSWLRVGEAEAMYSQVMSGSHNFDKAQYAEKRLTACTKRYTYLLEALARVRRTMIQAVQINIADKQIVMGAVDGN